MYLYVSAPDLYGSLSSGSISERLVQCPYPVVLGNRQSAEGSIKGAASKSNQGLQLEKFQVHLPYSWHLVQEDEGLLEKRIDFGELCGIDGGIEPTQMARAEGEILQYVSL